MSDVSNQAAQIAISVVYALPQAIHQKALLLPAGSSIADAVRQSGLLALLPETEVEQLKLGVYGKLKPAGAVLQDGDRVEIYRPLIADPKESRRRRAEHTPRPKKWQPNQKRPPA
ncbi:RnfH family protein [Massilia sp. W12]|uniref:RnfH family protein n=1 Tax=Massilia sp. W12 TaxID=3126507 RepID=UPI0030CE5A68